MKRRYLTPILLLLFGGQAASACDLCAIYSAQQTSQSLSADDLTLGVFEQFTSFKRLQMDGKKVNDPADQFLHSSVTQVFARYSFTDSLSIQGTLPLIYRTYRRPEGTSIHEGTVSGLGDIPVLLLYSPIEIRESDYSFRLTLQSGVKMATGDSGRIGEELDEGHSMGTKHGGHEHEAIPSGVHGHDLALGSGSWDIINGANIFGTAGRWLTSGSVQYAYRNEGDFGYRYADDFLWDFGIGRYLLLEDRGTIALRGNLLGEAKGKDRLHGALADDTGITSLFGGPELNVTFEKRLFASFAVDLPISVNNTATQLTPDYRIRMALTYRF